MKKIILIVVLAIFLKPILPVLDYAINYNYISKVLCENKAKPELKCNGKCHLMKELAKAAESEKPISSDKKTNLKQEVENWFFQDIKSVNLKQVYSNTIDFSSNNYSNLYFRLNSCSVFRPPIKT